ncbi:anthranilate phosphoribosyltransferase [Buchnera aphidicola str. Bp (Baizongia pistaciae)]|uniref:Anthranilate phosphoribosyltransferase n=1 Tax=Buchnera aphidicola subsp. Baizongia pistaciae (strain Bp) TaxID=224915 RepID=TRPD_BUCBP|nr:anthranilate phosphoribosyltransferase [Buchnera aphidicola]P59415.1 RecName: Full=Anthranilate phosphoribosyltransferase [Buchnera aphidicola str. Bp (Baizongia pistaciae)]AAO26987.1 anthranilate phosphoribosyltransferase [Buchnera aphidicola str. Bp (Baizongia pistaciae)]
MKIILNKIYQGDTLNISETYTLFKSIMLKKINNIELSAILIALKIRGESQNEILGAVKACLEHMITFPKPTYMFSDIVGTGGDNSNSINISTTSALVGSACGFKIAKHCNGNISSKTGSADILKKFGINIQISPEKSKKMLDELNICFLFAPQYHINFKVVTQVRKILRIKTIFNIIAPLLNPAMPKLTVMGVCNFKLMLPIAQVLKTLNYHHAIIVCSDNIDEVTLHSFTKIIELKNNNITSYILHPDDFGVKYCHKNDILGGNTEENYNIIKKILQGKGPSAVTETIAVNVAILFKIFGYSNLKKNTEYALKVIRSGKVYEKIIQLSKF